VILGCSMDSPEDNRAFKEKFDFPYDLLSDTDKSMSIAYGAAEADSPRPARISVLVGPDGKVAAVYPKVTPADHPDEVLATLNNLG
jgi:thioredoxin-dependent peroxiredoxin